MNHCANNLLFNNLSAVLIKLRIILNIYVNIQILHRVVINDVIVNPLALFILLSTLQRLTSISTINSWLFFTNNIVIFHTNFWIAASSFFGEVNTIKGHKAALAVSLFTIEFPVACSLSVCGHRLNPIQSVISGATPSPGTLCGQYKCKLSFSQLTICQFLFGHKITVDFCYRISILKHNISLRQINTFFIRFKFYPIGMSGFPMFQLDYFSFQIAINILNINRHPIQCWVIGYAGHSVFTLRTSFLNNIVIFASLVKGNRAKCKRVASVQIKINLGHSRHWNIFCFIQLARENSKCKHIAGLNITASKLLANRNGDSARILLGVGNSYLSSISSIRSYGRSVTIWHINLFHTVSVSCAFSIRFQQFRPVASPIIFCTKYPQIFVTSQFFVVLQQLYLNVCRALFILVVLINPNFCYSKLGVFRFGFFLFTLVCESQACRLHKLTLGFIPKHFRVSYLGNLITIFARFRYFYLKHIQTLVIDNAAIRASLLYNIECIFSVFSIIKNLFDFFLINGKPHITSSVITFRADARFRCKSPGLSLFIPLRLLIQQIESELHISRCQIRTINTLIFLLYRNIYRGIRSIATIFT